jgi:NADH:ubiquinone oxidoreductase subunit 6 (subunit J)
VIAFLFLLISVLGLLAALGTVLARNLVHAALFLVAFFFTIACQFVLLEAEFLAVIQVLIYIGAVAILLLFGIMLTRNIQGDETTAVGWPTRILGAIIGLAVFGVLFVGIWEQKARPGQLSWSQMGLRPAATMPPEGSEQKPSVRALAVNNMTRVIGDEMMTRYVVAFEVAGLLLTAALVGAIALALLEGQDEPPRPDAWITAKPEATTGPGSPNGAETLEPVPTSSTPTLASQPR